MIGLLHKSLNSRDKIMIYYMDGKGKVSQRVIRVVDIDNKRALAYCYYRKQVRSFKLNNILSCGPIKRSA
ncbi:hypothetical protein [Oceanobacillus locisalsi]|uniref:WYL domain-containing protein n=1 Tax=Oceanobacillus locisalsi TaxID=546107 RepID=A0ABW3NG91_9BACI